MLSNMGVVRGAGRRGSACAVLCFYVCTDVLFLYFRCILAFFVFVRLYAYGVIKKGWIIIVRADGRHKKGGERNCEKMCEENCEVECENRCEWL